MTNLPLEWQKFDADKSNPKTEQNIRKFQSDILMQAGVNELETEAARRFSFACERKRSKLITDE